MKVLEVSGLDYSYISRDTLEILIVLYTELSILCKNNIKKAYINFLNPRNRDNIFKQHHMYCLQYIRYIFIYLVNISSGPVFCWAPPPPLPLRSLPAEGEAL